MSDKTTDTSGATEAAAPAARAHHAGDGGAVAGGAKRFSAKRKLAAVQRLMRGESLDAVSREENVPVHRLTEWRDKILMGAESALKERERDARDEEIARRAGPRWARSPWTTNCSTPGSTSWRVASNARSARNWPQVSPSIRAAVPRRSWAWPGSKQKSLRLPGASARAMILVVIPPRERPMAWLSAPLLRPVRGGGP